MKTYKSFGALARALERASERLPETLAVAMEKSAVLVEETAKAEIGHYQRVDMGPFTPWATLTPATVAEKQRLGYATPGHDNPELRTGEMRDSITHESTFHSFEVGSADPVLLYQELGTSRGLPPRPILAPALYRNVPNILNILGKTIKTTLEGK